VSSTIDRARRARPGTSNGSLGIDTGVNRTRLFFILGRFLIVFRVSERLGGGYMVMCLVESIELVELDLEPVMVYLESTQGRIGLGFTVIVGVLVVFGVFEGLGVGLDGQVSSRNGRARRAGPGTSYGLLGIDTGANRTRVFCNLGRLLVVFRVFEGRGGG